MDLGNAYFQIVTEPARSLVRIVRSHEAMPRDEESVRRAFTALVEPLQHLAGYRALIDLRNGPTGRNDDEFERAARSVQGELVRRFSRVAFLVRSAVGKLQVGRLGRERGSGNSNNNVFLDEREALRFLTEEAA
jgi:hypothetical protein